VKDKRKHDQIAVTSLVNINVARKMNGLPPLEKKMRDCLRCEKRFESHGPSHRICCIPRGDRF